MAFTRSQHERRLTDREEGYKQKFCFNLKVSNIQHPSSKGGTLNPEPRTSNFERLG